MLFFMANIVAGVVVFILIYVGLRHHYDKGLKVNGIDTIATIDKYDTWDDDICCFFHFETVDDNHIIYGRTRIHDLDIMKECFPPETRVRIKYDSKTPKNWRFLTDEKGYYIKV